jgi:NAD(P)-dependent dehydrogenase (short-subunit alcohol dehydrogenase family)
MKGNAPTGQSLAGRVAIVTGAAGGIGAAIAEALAREGARVVVADRDEATGQSVASMIGDAADFALVDVTSYESVQALVGETTRHHARLDIMINNAGIGNPYLSVLDMPVDEYLRTIAVNQHGCFYGIKAAGNAMRERGGVIINTTSIYGEVAARGQVPYCTSKGAVVMMTKAAARDLARYNIRVVAIAPGLIDTGFSRRHLSDTAQWQAVERAHLRRRAGKPEDIANLAVFLASDAARFLNGQVYHADDGYTAFKP